MKPLFIWPFFLIGIILILLWWCVLHVFKGRAAADKFLDKFDQPPRL